LEKEQKGEKNEYASHITSSVRCAGIVNEMGSTKLAGQHSSRIGKDEVIEEG
jgi:hypothetical protein